MSSFCVVAVIFRFSVETVTMNAQRAETSFYSGDAMASRSSQRAGLVREAKLVIATPLFYRPKRTR